jgi:hypothetical protein
VIDIDPQRGWRQLPGVPDRGGHGIHEEELVREMTADGFEVVARYDDWTGDGERYCVVFRRGHDVTLSPAGPVAVRASPGTSPE